MSCEQMSNVEKAKEIIKNNFVPCGIYDCRNWAGDPMSTIYDDDGLRIDICYSYEYFEVFGLTHAEFHELETYYRKLGKGRGCTP